MNNIKSELVEWFKSSLNDYELSTYIYPIVAQLKVWTEYYKGEVKRNPPSKFFQASGGMDIWITEKERKEISRFHESCVETNTPEALSNFANYLANLLKRKNVIES